MTDYVVSSAVTSTSVTLSSGDTMEVVSGGTASRTFVDSGGREIVSAGGSDISALVNPGGEQDVYGSASGDTVAGNMFGVPKLVKLVGLGNRPLAV